MMFRQFFSTLRRFIKHRLFFSFYLPSLLFAIALGLRSPVLPLYARSLSEDYFLIGLVVAGAGLGTLVADLPAGGLLRRMDKHWGMLIGIGIDAVSTLGLFWVNSVWLALVLRFLTGVGIAIYGVARHAYISEAVRLEIRGRAIALFGGIMRIGLFLGPALGGLLAARFGLRMPFWVYAIFSSLAILVIFMAREKFNSDPSVKDLPDEETLGLLAALRGRWAVFMSASFAHVLAQITRAGQRLILPLFAADVLLLSPDQIGLAVSLSSAVSMTLFYPVGLIMDHLGRKLTIIPSFVLMGVGLALLPLTGSYAAFLLVGAVIGLGHGLGSGAMMTLGSDLAPQKGRSTYLGAWRWIGDAGNSGGPALVGVVADALALPAASLVIAAAGFLAGGIFALLVPETLKKPNQPTSPGR
jgi:MFS family permease